MHNLEIVRVKFLLIVLSVIFFNSTTGLAMDSARAERIIQAYGATWLETSDYLVANVSRLSHSKDEIKEAILFLMPLMDRQNCEYLGAAYVELGTFQNVREIKMLDLPEHVIHLRDDELYELIESTKLAPDWLPLNEYVLSEMTSLLEELPGCL